jgi:hypothetical protein
LSNSARSFGGVGQRRIVQPFTVWVQIGRVVVTVADVQAEKQSKTPGHQPCRPFRRDVVTG